MKKIITLLTIIMVAAPMFGQLDLVKRNLTALDTVKAMKELKVRDTAINVLIQKHTGFPYTKTLEKDSITLWSYYRDYTYKYFTIDTSYSGIQLGYGGMDAGFAGAIDEEGPRNDLQLQSITGIHHITHDSTGFHYTSNPDTAGWGNRSKNYFVTAPWVLDRIASGSVSLNYGSYDGSWTTLTTNSYTNAIIATTTVPYTGRYIFWVTVYIDVVNATFSSFGYFTGGLVFPDNNGDAEFLGHIPVISNYSTPTGAAFDTYSSTGIYYLAATSQVKVYCRLNELPSTGSVRGFARIRYLKISD
jgi:hypothetical protein